MRPTFKLTVSGGGLIARHCVRAAPGHATSRHATPRSATPGSATPRRVTPRHARPRPRTSPVWWQAMATRRPGGPVARRRLGALQGDIYDLCALRPAALRVGSAMLGPCALRRPTRPPCRRHTISSIVVVAERINKSEASPGPAASASRQPLVLRMCLRKRKGMARSVADSWGSGFSVLGSGVAQRDHPALHTSIKL